VAAIYDQLLDATIQHLQELKAEGERYVSVTPEALKALTQPVPKKSVAAEVSAAAAGGSFAATRTAMAAPKNPRFSTASGSSGFQPVVNVPPMPRLTQAPVVPPIPATKAVLVPTPVPFQTPPPLDPAAKEAAMAALREKVLPCVKCAHLAGSRKQVVFGVGTVHTQIMFVGEAPGVDEDVQGEPFVGAAGQLLTRIIKAMGFEREQVYIANILKCRPNTPSQAFGNRKPTPEEMQTCIPYLQQQIDIIQPKVLVALGATAVEGLLAQVVTISRLRGNWQTYRGIPLMPTFHPSYVLRNQSITTKRSNTSWRKMRKASAGACEDESWLKQVCKWSSVGAPSGNSGSSCA
jgi:DNA polymerase